MKIGATGCRYATGRRGGAGITDYPQGSRSAVAGLGAILPLRPERLAEKIVCAHLEAKQFIDEMAFSTELFRPSKRGVAAIQHCSTGRRPSPAMSGWATYHWPMVAYGISPCANFWRKFPEKPGSRRDVRDLRPLTAAAIYPGVTLGAPSRGRVAVDLSGRGLGSRRSAHIAESIMIDHATRLGSVAGFRRTVHKCRLGDFFRSNRRQPPRSGHHRPIPPAQGGRGRPI